jgi:hypothetical protein
MLQFHVLEMLDGRRHSGATGVGEGESRSKGCEEGAEIASRAVQSSGAAHCVWLDPEAEAVSVSADVPELSPAAADSVETPGAFGGWEVPAANTMDGRAISVHPKRASHFILKEDLQAEESSRFLPGRCTDGSSPKSPRRVTEVAAPRSRRSFWGAVAEPVPRRLRLSPVACAKARSALN